MYLHVHVQCMLELPCSKAISTHFLIAYKLCKSDRKGLVMTSVPAGWRRGEIQTEFRVCHWAKCQTGKNGLPTQDINIDTHTCRMCVQNVFPWLGTAPPLCLPRCMLTSFLWNIHQPSPSIFMYCKQSKLIWPDQNLVLHWLKKFVGLN